MRRVEKITKYGRDQYAFLEASEIPALMRQFPRSARGGGWYGDTSEGLMRKAELGDNTLVAESEKFLASIEDQIPLSRGWRNVDDVVGAIPNVPAFLAGHPQHMRRRERTARDNAPLMIYMDLTSSAMIDAKDVQKRGIVLLALVRMLVEHRPVELWVGTSKGESRRYGGGVSGTVAWRIDTAPMDLARAAYHIGSSAMSRGFGYGLDDSLHQTGGGWPFGDYMSHRHFEKRLRDVVDFGELLYIPPIYGNDELVDKPVQWLKRVMATYVKEEA